MKKTFKQIISNVNPPKKLLPDEKLPQIFDTLFDVKYGSDILENWYNVLSKKKLYSLLAEHGYDAKDIKENYEKDQIIINNQKFNKISEVEIFDIMARKDVLAVAPFVYKQNRLFFVLADGQEEYYYNEADQEFLLGDWEAYITNFKDKGCFNRDDYNSFPLDLFWAKRDADPFELWENFKISAKQYLESEHAESC